MLPKKISLKCKFEALQFAFSRNSKTLFVGLSGNLKIPPEVNAQPDIVRLGEFTVNVEFTPALRFPPNSQVNIQISIIFVPICNEFETTKFSTIFIDPMWIVGEREGATTSEKLSIFPLVTQLKFEQIGQTPLNAGAGKKQREGTLKVTFWNKAANLALCMKICPLLNL